MPREHRAARGGIENLPPSRSAGSSRAAPAAPAPRRRAPPSPPRGRGCRRRSPRAGAGGSPGSPRRETPSLTSLPIRRSSEATAANCALSFSISSRRVASRALTWEICRSMSEASSERPGSSIRATSCPAVIASPSSGTRVVSRPLPREGHGEALLLRDREQAQRLARVVLSADELAVAPCPGHRNAHRQDDPEDPFHHPQD